MCKKLLKLMIYLGLTMMFFNILIREETENQHRGSSVVRIGEETVSAFWNGMDITEQYQKLEEKVKENVARYFNKECSEIRFFNYCMLEMAGMTIEAVVEDVNYTILFNIEGEIINISEGLPASSRADRPSLPEQT